MSAARTSVRNSVHRTVLWAVGSLGLVAILAFAVLFTVTTRLQQRLNTQMAVMLTDESVAQTALNLAHQQMFMAARYVFTPDTAIEARFRELGHDFYGVLREYLRRDLTQDERRRVERIRQAHEQLEVYAFDAFSYARAGQHELARDRSLRMARNADELQQEITAFLLERRPQRTALEAQFAAAMRWVYVGAAINLLLLVLGTWAIAQLLRARLVTPLQELKDAAARVGPGSAPLQVRPSGVAEIHAVADGFQQMSTRLLNAQQQTTEAHRRFGGLVASIQAIVWEADARTYAPTFVSAYAETLLGYPTADWIGNFGIWQRVMHADDYDAVMSACRRASATGKGHELEYRMITRSGDTLWVRDLVQVAMADGAAETLRGVIVDITAQRADREALEHSEERFRALIENSSDTVTVVDANGATVYSGPSLTRVLGYQPEERAGRSVLEIVHPDDVGQAADLMREALQRRVSDTVINIRARHADGSWRWLEVKARNLLDHPAVRGIVLNSADITERQQAQQALEASEEQLRHAQKLEAIGRLAAGVAHDFNNILTTIHGYVDLLLEQASAQPVRDDLVEVKVAADRAVDLTRQLLAFGRKQMLQPQVLNICDAVRDVERMLSRLIGETIEVGVECHTLDTYARVDRGQLHQILMNLAVNARDAMPRGGRLLIAVSSQTSRAPLADHVPAGTWVVLQVSDTGAGMDEDTAARIFEPFFTTKPIGQGTGLGLSTVYGIVKQSGGHLAVRSEIGVGSTFTIWLPRAQAVRAHAAGPELSHAAPHEHGATVLVAEDEAAVRGLVERLLKGRGYVVVTASNGREAIEYLEHHDDEVDVVLADMVMPQGSGADITEAVARSGCNIPVILMSGYSEEEALDHVRAIKPNVAFLSKPFSARQLYRAIDDALERPAD